MIASFFCSSGFSNPGACGVVVNNGKMCRLAIARALNQNSSILILDEATSALDSMSELLVRQALERVMQDHTVNNKASQLFSSKQTF